MEIGSNAAPTAAMVQQQPTPTGFAHQLHIKIFTARVDTIYATPGVYCLAGH